MPSKNSRPLHKNELVEYFLTNVLEMSLDDSNYDCVSKIVATELNIQNFDEKQITSRSNAYRHHNYRADKDRLKLKRTIVNELLSKKRLKKDDEIKLGKGGAAPRNPFQQNKQAYILIGLPASGKSTIANAIAEDYGALILDADYAKRKLPEFLGLPFGATLVHEESLEIIFGEESSNGYQSLLQKAVEYGINL
ncbi:MAG: zeta toxin family protein, partial [Bacteroidia bacterium]